MVQSLETISPENHATAIENFNKTHNLLSSFAYCLGEVARSSPPPIRGRISVSTICSPPQFSVIYEALSETLSQGKYHYYVQNKGASEKAIIMGAVLALKKHLPQGIVLHELANRGYAQEFLVTREGETTSSPEIHSSIQTMQQKRTKPACFHSPARLHSSEPKPGSRRYIDIIWKKRLED